MKAMLSNKEFSHCDYVSSIHIFRSLDLDLDPRLRIWKLEQIWVEALLQEWMETLLLFLQNSCKFPYIILMKLR